MEPETDWGHMKAKHILKRDRRSLYPASRVSLDRRRLCSQGMLSWDVEISLHYETCLKQGPVEVQVH